MRASRCTIGTVFAAVRVQAAAPRTRPAWPTRRSPAAAPASCSCRTYAWPASGMLACNRRRTPANYPPIDVDTSGGVTTVTLRGAFANVVTTLAGAASAGRRLSASTLRRREPSRATLVLVDSGLSSRSSRSRASDRDAGSSRSVCPGQLQNAISARTVRHAARGRQLYVRHRGGRRCCDATARSSPRTPVFRRSTSRTTAPSPPPRRQRALGDDQLSGRPPSRRRCRQSVREVERHDRSQHANLAFRFSMS